MPDTLTDPTAAIKQLQDQQAHASEALYAIAQVMGREAPADVTDLVTTVKAHVNALNPERYTFPPQADPPTPTARAFGVWNGITIKGSLGQVFNRVKALVPPGNWAVEWYPKAGEGGSWQRTLSDPNGLTGEAMLRDWVRQGADTGVDVIPYVVVRGRAEWNTAEWEQIRACVDAAGRCILNLEPGAPYWNGPKDALAGTRYLRALGVPPEALELCAIPRMTQINELGGPKFLQGWLDGVARASWECYEDAPAPQLAPGYAIPHVVQPLTSDPLKQIPLVQRSMIDRYHDSEWCANGMEVWHLDGN